MAVLFVASLVDKKLFLFIFLFTLLKKKNKENQLEKTNAKYSIAFEKSIEIKFTE